MYWPFGSMKMQALQPLFLLLHMYLICSFFSLVAFEYLYPSESTIVRPLALSSTMKVSATIEVFLIFILAFM